MKTWVITYGNPEPYNSNDVAAIVEAKNDDEATVIACEFLRECEEEVGVWPCRAFDPELYAVYCSVQFVPYSYAKKKGWTEPCPK